MIISHEHQAYKAIRDRSGFGKYNGAFYYSQEIVKNIIPNVKTDRNWVTINIHDFAYDHAIVFIHNNMHPEFYDWLNKFDDLILVCGIGETCKKVKHLGKAIYLPLSVDVEYVKTFRTEQTKDTAFVGRKAKRKSVTFPQGTAYLESMPRDDLLKKMAEYKNVYAVGRTAIEAKVLGCKILPYDPRFPDPRRWRIVDNLEASQILQEKLDKIDGR